MELLDSFTLTDYIILMGGGNGNRVADAGARQLHFKHAQN